MGDPMLAAAAGAALVLLWVALVWRTRRWWRSVRARQRAARAGAGERVAEELLRRLGYRIEGRQVRAKWTIEVDGDPHNVELRADLLASRDGLLYVAEVKTGDLAPSLGNASTRRQLLEYFLAYRSLFGVGGVLLVAPELDSAREVVFPKC